MSVALKLYEQLTEAEDDKARAKLIAEAIEQVEDRFPHIHNLATQGHLRESELRLQKEIAGVRLEIKQVESRLQKEIAGVRLEVKQVEIRLIKWVIGVAIASFTGISGLIYWMMERMLAVLG